MSFDAERAIKLLKEWANSDDAKAFFARERFKNELKIKRFERFEKYLETHDFNNLIYRLILENGDEWREKCYHKGYEPYPTNMLQFVFDYVIYKTENLEEIPEEIDCNFPTNTFEFNGYYFQITYGQGSFISIYNKEDKKLLLSV
jgi:hypothetical protein